VPYRWVICPAVTITRPDLEGGDPDVFRAPKVTSYIEPGRGKYYQHSSAIDTGTWCLALVKANDWTPINADAECISLLESDFADLNHINLTPRQLGFNTARLTRIRNRLAARGVDIAGLTLDTPLEQILDRLAKVVAIFFRVRNLRL